MKTFKEKNKGEKKMKNIRKILEMDEGLREMVRKEKKMNGLDNYYIVKGLVKLLEEEYNKLKEYERMYYWKEMLKISRSIRKIDKMFGWERSIKDCLNCFGSGCWK